MGFEFISKVTVGWLCLRDVAAFTCNDRGLQTLHACLKTRSIEVLNMANFGKLFRKRSLQLKINKWRKGKTLLRLT